MDELVKEVWDAREWQVTASLQSLQHTARAYRLCQSILSKLQRRENTKQYCDQNPPSVPLRALYVRVWLSSWRYFGDADILGEAAAAGDDAVAVAAGAFVTGVP